MKNIQWVLLIYALMTIAALIGLGVSISFHNGLVSFGFFAIFIMTMALGFIRKRKLRNAGKL